MKARGLVILAALALVAADAKEDVKKEKEKLQGKWKAVSIEANNEKAPEGDVQNFIITIKDDVLTAVPPNGGEQKGKIVVDPSVKPKILDFTYIEGDQKDRKLEGIYELDKDDLKICVRVQGNDRPTEFKGGEGTILLVLKREKP